MRQISGGDAFYLFTDKESRHQHISALYIYDPSTAKEQPLRFKTILNNIEDRLGSSPIFRQKLVKVPMNLDYPYWINDPEFDLEYHVRHIALPKPGDWRQLCIQVSRLHARSLDMTRPLWETYVIEGLDNIDFLPKGAFAIVTKMHHVAIDGVGAAELTMGLHDLEPYPATRRRKVRWRPGQAPGTAKMLSRAAVNNTRAVLRSGRTLGNTLGRSVLGHLRGESEESLAHPPGPPTRFNKSISPHRVWDAARFSLDDFRRVKALVPGATINDVVLTVCGGAMHRYLDKHNETPAADLSALVPISVRAESERGQAGNKVHLARTSLCSTDTDAMGRLEKVRDAMLQVKAANAVSAREMVEIQEQLPAPTLMMAGRAVAASRGPGKAFRESHNMVITNVPGPQQPLYFCGARLVMFTGLAVISDNLGISHAVTSYDGTLVIAPLADRQMMPDPEFYAGCLRDAFAELLAQTKKSASKKRKTATPKRKTRTRRTKAASAGA